MEKSFKRFMNTDKEQVLSGGNMSQPRLKEGRIYKEASKSTPTIHKLLNHVRDRGIHWVPQSFGIDDKGRHVLEYLEGFVPHEDPRWPWEESILKEAAKKLRVWHDCTSDFSCSDASWFLENDEKSEVICHNDFAPYNCVFNNKKLTGIIDFDVCSPGSRLWDMAYTAYRFIPLFPNKDSRLEYEKSPFSREQMKTRINLFLEAYSSGDSSFFYNRKELIQKVKKRLKALSAWSHEFGVNTENRDIIENAKMYDLHSDWVLTLLRPETLSPR